MAVDHFNRHIWNQRVQKHGIPLAELLFSKKAEKWDSLDLAYIVIVAQFTLQSSKLKKNDRKESLNLI